MTFDDLHQKAGAIAELLLARGERVAVAEGSAGGLVSAALLSVTGASRWYTGGVVAYSGPVVTAWVRGKVEPPRPIRGASEPFAMWLARSAAAHLETTWGLGEAGAAGPPNPYGDPAGHSWVAVTGPTEATRNVLTGVDDRVENMFLFAAAALDLFTEVLGR